MGAVKYLDYRWVGYSFRPVSICGVLINYQRMMNRKRLKLLFYQRPAYTYLPIGNGLFNRFRESNSLSVKRGRDVDQADF
jgi:hypothetical protein